MSGHSATDGELVARARKGDVDAFRQLYERHVGGVYALLRSSLRDRDLVEDIVQTAFIRAWDRLARLRDGDAFKVWIRQTARRAMIDEIRKRRLREADSLDENEESGHVPTDPAAAPPEALTRAEMAERVRGAVAGLPAHQREVVTLHYLDGMEVKSVAQVLEVPLGTVLSRLARARNALKRKLGGFMDDWTEGGA